MINNVFEFNDTTEAEVMTHRTDIFAIDINDDIYKDLNYTYCLKLRLYFASFSLEET